LVLSFSQLKTNKKQHIKVLANTFIIYYLSFVKDIKPKSMKRQIMLLLSIFTLVSCAELQEVVNQLPQSDGISSNTDIASGLREALNNIIDKQVTKLTLKDGFYRNDLIKILLPEKLHKVDTALRTIGFGNLA